MKRILQLLTVLPIVSALAFSQGTTITVLHVNDTHSHIDGFGHKDANLNGLLGGIARAATVIGTVKATEPNVLLLHAGDLSVGDPFYNTYFGIPEYQMMLQLGFDAMTAGNHEFDFGPGPLNDVLSTAFAGGSFPLISANLNMDGFPVLKTWIQPAIMKQFGNVKVRIFGMTVPNEPTYNPAPVVVLDGIIPIAQHMADSLRGEGAKVVIFLSHLGFYSDKIVATNTSGIDFIIGGHDHFLFEQPMIAVNTAGKTVPIFQAGEFYKYIGELHFTFNNGTMTMNDYHIIALDSTITPEPTTQGIIDELKQGITTKFGDLYHTVAGTAKYDISKKFDPASPLRDTPMGNLVTDVFRAKTGTDIGFTADGLISEGFYAGPIVGADVFRALSYGDDAETGLGFKLTTFKITGVELRKGLEISLSQLEVNDDFSPQVSGMTFKYDSKRPVGHRVVDGSIKINGMRCVPVREYTVTSNSGLPMLLQALGVKIEELRELPYFEITTVKEFIASLGTVTYTAEGRIWDNSIYSAAKQDVVCPKLYSQSYPNPFNPATTISFTLPADARVTLNIYNNIGQVVSTLLSVDERGGDHSVTWNALNVPSGVYFYRIVAGDFVQTKKMILMK